MQFTWNGNDGSYTDATQWTPEGVPLYDNGDTAVIQSGTVTLSNAAPDNITIFLGGTNAATQPDLVLNNAALGPDVQLLLTPFTPRQAPGFETITVQGYDTNYGTISYGQSYGDLIIGGPENATIAIAPYSQLNQEGRIDAGSSLRITGSSDAPATLNNDGTIDVSGGSIAISADVIGSGTIAFEGGPLVPFGTGLVEFGGGVSASQHISLSGPDSVYSAANLRIDDPSAFHGVIDRFLSASQARITLANTQATGAFFAQVTPDSGALLLLNGQQVVDALTVTGAHATNAYGVSSNADGSTTIMPVSSTSAAS